MPLSVEIDSQSGFCGGVIRAIGRAESFLEDHERLYSLGAIVHNEAELERLGRKGLVTIGMDSLADVPREEGESLLIRAHGESPVTYDIARELGYKVIDCTCPVVLRLQTRIREAYAALHSDGRDGQVVIFGKIGHAEVNGLVGQVRGDALVIENESMLRQAIEEGKVRLEGPVEVFSQTTKSPSEYVEICALLRTEMARCKGMGEEEFEKTGLLKVNDTICSQVASRHAQLSRFAMEHDIIVFVSGKDSSNGKVLCELCRNVNIRTFHISSPEDVKRDWFRADDRVGICGATSTPKWLMEEVAEKILQENR